MKICFHSCRYYQNQKFPFVSHSCSCRARVALVSLVSSTRVVKLTRSFFHMCDNIKMISLDNLFYWSLSFNWLTSENICDAVIVSNYCTYGGTSRRYLISNLFFKSWTKFIRKYQRCFLKPATTEAVTRSHKGQRIQEWTK